MAFPPFLDILVWLTFLGLLVLLGARAWVVETGQARIGRTPAKVQVLTGASVAALALLVTLVSVQGGALLVNSIITRTDPADVVYATDPNAVDPNAVDPNAVDPNAPPVDPNAPPPAAPEAPPGG